MGRVPGDRGTDAFTNVADRYTPGGGRVYARSGGELRYEKWIRAYKPGRSFASNGPVIRMTVDGKEPGEEIRADAPRAVRVKALVRTQVPVDKVEIVVNGKVVVSRRELTLDDDVPLSRSSWIAVRALGPWHRLVLNDAQAFAHSSPVYAYFGNQPIGVRSDVRFYIDWIEKLIARTSERGRFASEERKAEVIALFRRALEKYRALEAAADE